MGTKTRRWWAVVAAVFTALALFVAPKTALAERTLWQFTDSTSGCSFWIEDDLVTNPTLPHEVTVTVNLDGNEVYSEKVQNLAPAAGRLCANLSDGYDVRVSTTGNVSAGGSDETTEGPWIITFGAGNDDGEITIDLLSNRIETEWGTINFTNATGEGYNLTVRLYVNGSRVYTSRQLRVAGSALNGLKFNEADGYHYISGLGANAYDFHTTNPGSTWNNDTGTLTFSNGNVDRNHNNTLDIYLWTFSDYANLRVNREDSLDTVGRYMNGYELSYELDGETYSYTVTNFDTTQPQTVPLNVPITIRAICKTGWEVDEWRNDSPANAELSQQGNSAVVTIHSYTDGQAITIRAMHVCPMPEKPSFDDLEKLFGDSLVKIDCTNNTIDPEHGDKTYGPVAGGVSIGEVVNNGGTYTVDLTVSPYIYVAMYSAEDDIDAPHMLDPGDQGNETVSLTWDDGKWVKNADQQPVEYKVTCSNSGDEEIILPPTPERIEELLANGAVRIDCVKNVGHADQTYGLVKGAYTIGEVVESDDGTYTVTVTVAGGEYVLQYENDTLDAEDTAIHHWLEPDNQTGIFTFTYDTEDKTWELTSEEPITFKVMCAVEKDPEIPAQPGWDDLKDILKVAVSCVNEMREHNKDSVTYKLFNNTFTVGEPRLDKATNEYVYDVTITADDYVSKYNRDDAKAEHWLAAGQSATDTVTVAYSNGKWEAIDGNPAEFEVTCFKPETPDWDDINEISGVLTVDCVNEDASDHVQNDYKFFNGSWTAGEPVRNDDGSWTSSVEVIVDQYVAKYNEKYGDHDLAEGQGQTVTVKLVTTDGNVWTLQEKANVSVVCAEGPDAPTFDDVKGLFDVVVKCTEEAAHGSQHFAPEGGTVSIVGHADGTATVTVDSDWYVGVFDDTAGAEHSPAHQTAQVKLAQSEDGSWALADGQPGTVTFEVACASEPSGPDAPTFDDVKGLFDVVVKCTEEAAHGSQHFAPEGGTVSIVGHADGTATVTVDSDWYVGVFDDTAGAEHSPAHQTAQVKLAQSEDGSWALADGQPGTVTFEVACASEPSGPDAPTFDDVKGLFDVVVKCTEEAAHGSQHFAPEGGTVSIVGHADGTATVTVDSDWYVGVFDDTAGAEHSPAHQTAQVKLAQSEDGSWALADGQPGTVTFEVACASEPSGPDAPTFDDVKGLFDVVVKCTEEAAHGSQHFAPEGGTVSIVGHADGTATVTVDSDWYVGVFDDTAGAEHSPAHQTAQVKLAQSEDGSWALADGQPGTVTFEVACASEPSGPDAPTFDDVKGLFDVVVKCTEEAAHGSQHFAPEGGTVSIVGHADGTATVTVDSDWYVGVFDDTAGAEHSPAHQTAQVKLAQSEDGSWALADGQPGTVTFEVACDGSVVPDPGPDPDPEPTPDPDPEPTPDPDPEPTPDPDPEPGVDPTPDPEPEPEPEPEPGTDEPGTDEPGTDEPGTDKPGTDEPGTTPGGNTGTTPGGNDGGRLPSAGDPTSIAPVLIGGSGVVLTGIGLYLKRRM